MFREQDTPERLKNWMDDIDTMDIDDILEWLEDSQMFNAKGKKFRHLFWKRYIKE